MPTREASLSLKGDGYISTMEKIIKANFEFADTQTAVQKSMAQTVSESEKLNTTIVSAKSKLNDYTTVTERLKKSFDAQGNAIKSITTTINEDTIARERNKAAQLAQEAASKRKVAVGGFVEDLNKRVSFAGASDIEVKNYQAAVQKVNDLLIQQKTNLGQVRLVLANLDSGSKLFKYKDDLRKVQNALIGVKTAADGLGAAGRKEMQQLADASAKAARTAERAAQQHSAAAAKIAAADIIKAKAAQLAQEAASKRKVAVGGFVEDLNKRVSFAGASDIEVKNYQAAVQKVNDLLIQQKTDLSQVRLALANLDSGSKLFKYKDDLRKVQIALIGVKTAANGLGAAGRKEMQQLADASAKAARAAERAAQQHSAAAAKIAADLIKAKAASQQFLISWQSVRRLLVARVAYRAISAITTEINQALETSKQLSIALAEVQTISQDQPIAIGRWRSELRGLSDEFGLPIVGQVEAAYQALSNQVVKGANTFGFLRSANELAVATVADTAQAVDALSSIINAFQLDASDANEIAASLFKTVELGRVRLGEMSKTIGRTSATANVLGLSYKELLAQIATLTVQGVPFERAQTQILGIMQKLIKPTSEMQALYTQWGVSTGEAAIKAFGFRGVMDRIALATGGASDKLSALIPRVRGLTGAIIQITTGADAYKKAMSEMENATESYQTAVKQVLNSTGQQIKITTEQISNAFLEVASDVQDSVIGIIQTMGGAKAGAEVLATTIRGVLIPALGALVGALGAIAVANPLSAAIVAATTSLGYLLGQIQKLLSEEQDYNNTVTAMMAKNFEGRSRLAEAYFESRGKLLKISLENDTRTLAKSQADINAIFNRAIKGNLDVITGRTEDYEGVFTGIKFDFGKALEPMLEKLKQNLNDSKTDLKKYEDELTKVKEALINLPAMRDDLIFKVEMDQLKDIPTSEDIGSIAAQIRNLENDTSVWVKTLTGAVKRTDEINRLTKERTEVILDQQRAQDNKTLDTQIENLEKVELQYEKNKKRIEEITAAEAARSNIQAPVKIEAASLKKSIDDLEKEKKTRGSSVELETELLQKRKRLSEITLKSSKDLKTEKSTLEAQNKTLSSGVAELNLAREARLKNNRESVAGQREQARMNMLLEQAFAINKRAEGQELAGDSKGIQDSYKALRDIGVEVIKINTEYQFAKDLNVNLLDIFNAETHALERIQVLMDQRNESEKLEQAAAELRVANFENARDALKKIDDIEKTIYDPTSTEQQRVKAAEDLRKALETVQQLHSGSNNELVKSIPNFDRMIQSAQNLKTIISEQFDIQTKIRVEQEKIAALDAKAAEAAAKIKTAKTFANEQQSQLSEQTGLALDSYDAIIAKEQELRKGKSQLRYDQETKEFVPTEDAKNIIKAKELREQLREAAEVYSNEVKNANISGSVVAAEKFAKILNDSIQLVGENNPLAEQFKATLDVLYKKLDNKYLETVQSEAVSRQIELNDLIQQQVNLTRDVTTLQNNLLVGVQSQLDPASQNADTFATSFIKMTDKSIEATKELANVIEKLKTNQKSDTIDALLESRGGPISYFARGGPSGTDTVPAWLTPGEFVINRKQSQIWGDLLQMINSGALTKRKEAMGDFRGAFRFNAGGNVTSATTSNNSTTNVGDININMRGSNGAQTDILTIGKLLKREIKKGTLSFA